MWTLLFKTTGHTSIQWFFFFACCIQSFCDTDQFFCLSINVTVQCEPLSCSSCCLPGGGSKSPLIPPMRETINSGRCFQLWRSDLGVPVGHAYPLLFPSCSSVSLPEVWKAAWAQPPSPPPLMRFCFKRSKFGRKVIYVNETQGNRQPVDSLIFT